MQKPTHLTISGIEIKVLRGISPNLKITVSRSTGRVTVTAPWGLEDDQLVRIISSKLDWIKKSLMGLKKLDPVISESFEDGTTLYLEGKAYQLKVIQPSSINRVVLREDGIIELRLKAKTPDWQRPILIQEWLRGRLKVRAEPLLAKWQEIIGEPIRQWGIKLMKTRWGTCNVSARRVWLNLMLATRPDDTLEYIIVHELVHLLERGHGVRFKAFMDQFLPDWRERKRRMDMFPEQTI